METKAGVGDTPTLEKFKSYYVVWKPMVKDERTEIMGLFKSYYVVWKLGVFFCAKEQRKSLNRTM